MKPQELTEDCIPLVLIVDDDVPLRTAIERQIKLMGYRVRGFTRAEDLLCFDEKPQANCIVLDLAMPGMTGLELQKELSVRGIQIPIVFLSGMIDVPCAVEAMHGGAVNVLEKPVEADALSLAIESAVARSIELDTDLSRIERNRIRFDRLTVRQKAVFEGIVAGNPNKVIAFEMGIGIRTVKAHRQQVMEKLEAGSVADLAFVASDLGLAPK